MVSEKSISVKFHGKANRFTNAKANQKYSKEMKAQLDKRIQEIKRNPGNVVLTKLKGHEIDIWCKSKGSRPKKRCLKPVKLTLKLRKR